MQLNLRAIKNFKIIKTLTELNIPVMGHIGYTPQFKKFKVEGNTDSKAQTLKEALLIEKAGVFYRSGMRSTKASKMITNSLSIPTIGIGSSNYCDGQILKVTDDLLGLSGFYPKFVKKYVSLTQ